MDDKKSTDVRRKKRKTAVLCVVVAAVWIGIQFGFGLMTPPKEYYIFYFEHNRSDFERAVEYSREQGGVIFVQGLSASLTSGEPSLFKTMLLGDFEAIDGYDKCMTFHCRNLFSSCDEPIAIVYNPEKNDEVYYESFWGEGDSYIKEEYTYERICDNWYIEYESRQG